jgi:hypothetical protein
LIKHFAVVRRKALRRREKSGYGREGGTAGLESCTVVENVSQLPAYGQR